MIFPVFGRVVGSAFLLLALAGCGGRSVSHIAPEPIRPKPEGCLIWQDEFLVLESSGEFVGVRPSDGLRRRVIGKPDCGEVTLNTLALSSWGDAYAADMMGQLFRIDAELACTPVLGPVTSEESFGGMAFIGPEGKIRRPPSAGPNSKSGPEPASASLPRFFSRAPSTAS